MATIKETGRLAYKGEVESGMAKNGNAWYRQTIVVDVEGYKGSFRKVALQASGNMVGEIEKVQIGERVEVTYQVTAREWNGKWYNNVDLYNISSLEVEQPAAPQSQPLIQPNTPMTQQEGDLPF
jgi:hypothetical protein